MATVTGTDNSETIDGADGVTNSADLILGLGGDDTIFGLGGNDTIKGGGGADTINGGSGIDTVSYADSEEAVLASVNGGLSGDALGDVLTSIENLTGSAFDDTLAAAGSDGINVLSGAAGDDRLKGGGGADTLNGGSGIDTASYFGADTGVLVDLALGRGFRGLGEVVVGDAEGDVLTSVENLEGSDFNDTLLGDSGANVLLGRDGNDVLDGRGGSDTINGGDGVDILRGGGGADILTGGADADTLTGGAGADTFRWLSTADAGTTFNTADFLSDFDRSEGDLLDFSAIDADVTASGNQSFDFIGREAFTEPGQVRWFTQGERTFIVLNTDTDGLREMIVEVEGLPTVEADWFIL
jgi:Ca2+-binding RTX toxin-like protein